MRIVGLLGSARKGGNSESLLDIALEEAQENGFLTSTAPSHSNQMGGLVLQLELI